MEIVLARIHQKEDASVKRERAMAYAFSHQVCILQDEKMSFSLLRLTEPIDMNTNYMICSGGQTPVRIMGWVVMSLVELIGVGAGWNVG